MEQLIEFLIEHTKKYSPFIVGGAIGAIIHKLRTQMSLTQFLGSIVISVFVAISVGIVCSEYFKLSNSVINVLCGIAGTFSKTILDEIEEIIKSASGIIKSRYGKTPVEEIEEEYVNEEEN